MIKAPRYTILDKWAFVGDDATKQNIEGITRTMKMNFASTPKLEVRQFRRDVRAGGATLSVTVVVARVKNIVTQPTFSDRSYSDIVRDGMVE